MPASGQRGTQRLMSTPRAARFWIGPSGWSYPDWKGVFYPKGVRQGAFLSHYASHFTTVEVDGSYYRAPTKGDCQRWAGMVPDGFTFSLKMPKRVVHGGEPRDRNLVPENSWSRERSGDLATAFIQATESLGDRRGPILLQCPRYPKRIYSDWRAFLDALLPGALPVVDEAYHEYACVRPDYPDGLRLLKEGRRLVVLRTFSKAYGLAGLRIGWGAGPADVMDALQQSNTNRFNLMTELKTERLEGPTVGLDR